MKHYIITNRQIIKDKDGMEVINPDGTEPPSDQLRFAEASVNDETGEVESIEVIEDVDFPEDVAYNFSAEDTDLKGSARCFKDIYNAMQAEVNDTLFFIHGFKCDLARALDNLKQLHQQYITDDSPIGRIVMFTWPSNGSLFEYRDDAHDAVTAGKALGRAYLKLRKFFAQFFELDPNSETHKNPPCNRNLHMMCHSMGNRVLESMVEMILAKNYNYTRLFREVILVASDIDNVALEEPKPLHNLVDIGDRIHVYFNENDFALTISQTTKNAFNRLGKYGPKNMKKVPNNINVIDVTDADDIKGGLTNRLLQHSYHFSSSSAREDICTVLNGNHTEEIEQRAYKVHKDIFRLEG